jgi:hypothetical protein
VGEGLVIDVHEARDEGTHRFNEEGRFHTDTLVIRSCMQQRECAIEMRGGAVSKCG